MAIRQFGSPLSYNLLVIRRQVWKSVAPPGFYKAPRLRTTDLFHRSREVCVCVCVIKSNYPINKLFDKSVPLERLVHEAVHISGSLVDLVLEVHHLTQLVYLKAKFKRILISGSQPFLLQVPVKCYMKSFVPENVCFAINCSGFWFYIVIRDIFLYFQTHFLSFK